MKGLTLEALCMTCVIKTHHTFFALNKFIKQSACVHFPETLHVNHDGADHYDSLVFAAR